MLFTKNKTKKFSGKRSSILQSFTKALTNLEKLNSDIEIRVKSISEERAELNAEEAAIANVREFNNHSITTLRGILEPNTNK